MTVAHRVSLEYDGHGNNTKPVAVCSCGWRGRHPREYYAALRGRVSAAGRRYLGARSQRGGIRVSEHHTADEVYTLPRGEAAVMGAIVASQATILAALAHLRDLPENTRLECAAAHDKAMHLARCLMGKGT